MQIVCRTFCVVVVALLLSRPARADLLAALTSPILFEGNENVGYRDPLLLHHDGVFHLFFTVGENEGQRVYLYVAHSTSRDLRQWAPARKLTPRNLNLNFVSPGSVTRFKDEWILTMASYPQPKNELYGNADARCYLMRSGDLEKWSEPEVIRVKGPDVPVEKMGRMIDPFFLEDKDEPGKWWCFYKQKGASLSWSKDLKSWTYFGNVEAGENVCVLVHEGQYLMFHSPRNGVGVKVSKDLKTWKDAGPLITLGQKDWPWARGRLTAGYVADLRTLAGVGKYVMVFHGTGPEPEPAKFLTHGCLGIAWSGDLKTWSWPKDSAKARPAALSR